MEGREAHLSQLLQLPQQLGHREDKKVTGAFLQRLDHPLEDAKGSALRISRGRYSGNGKSVFRDFIPVYSSLLLIFRDFIPDIPGLFEEKGYRPKDPNHKTGQKKGKNSIIGCQIGS